MLFCANFEQQFYPTEDSARDVGKGARGAQLSHDLIKTSERPGLPDFPAPPLVLLPSHNHLYLWLL
jgi:hypothetical protein